MKFIHLIAIIMLGLSGFVLAGCNRDAPEQGAPVQEEAPAEVDHEAEAEQEFNEENMEAELQRLEQEIEQDTNQDS